MTRSESVVSRGQHEAGSSADQDRFARATDRLDQFGQMVEIGLLRGVILLAQRQEPVLHHAGRLLIEGANFVDRHLHAMGDRFDQLFVVNFPAQPFADHPCQCAAAPSLPPG